MTYCVAIKVKEGVVALADGRLTSGTQVTVGQKITLHGNREKFFVATSGLRSLRDKTLAYLDRELRGREDSNYPTMLDAVEAFTAQMRAVARSDQEYLQDSDLSFNLHALVGGKLAEDDEPHVYLVYPEGNWVEVGERTPYLVIGETPYGKPVLDRALDFETPLATALKLAYLSFDSTRASASDVGFPIDIFTFNNEDQTWREAHYVDDDVRAQRYWWNDAITRIAHEMPDGPWVEDLLPAPLWVVDSETDAG
ncbi:MAG: peptidase [Alphaproteobacteria bacterium]|nr:peptidase [Alphaproteobacteria bacterium]